MEMNASKAARHKSFRGKPSFVDKKSLTLKKKTSHVYISLSFYCKLSILLSPVSIFFRFLRDFERKAFDFTNKSILFFSFPKKTADHN